MPLSVAVAALEANLWSMWSQFGRGPGCRLHEWAEALWFETPIPVLPYNMVVRFHGSAAPDRTIDGIFTNFAVRGVPFLWIVHPTAAPQDLPARLRARGFAEAELITGMTATVHELPSPPDIPAGVQVQSVGAGYPVASFIDFVASRWRVPPAAQPCLQSIAEETFRIGAPDSPNRAWVATRGGLAVAKAFTHDCGDTVGLYGMATRPEARGLGLGRLICLTALADARRRGRTLAVLHSTPMAVSLYRRIGFGDAARFHLFAAPGSFYA